MDCNTGRRLLLLPSSCRYCLLDIYIALSQNLFGHWYLRRSELHDDIAYMPTCLHKPCCVGLDLLAAELPRTFVVLLSPIDVALVSQLQDKGLVCEVAHKYECPCVFQNRGRGIKRVRWLHKQYKWDKKFGACCLLYSDTRQEDSAAAELRGQVQQRRLHRGEPHHLH